MNQVHVTYKSIESLWIPLISGVLATILDKYDIQVHLPIYGAVARAAASSAPHEPRKVTLVATVTLILNKCLCVKYGQLVVVTLARKPLIFASKGLSADDTQH